MKKSMLLKAALPLLLLASLTAGGCNVFADVDSVLGENSRFFIALFAKLRHLKRAYDIFFTLS